ncbi:MAG: nucleoside hydrolase [bacterium]
MQTKIIFHFISVITFFSISPVLSQDSLFTQYRQGESREPVRIILDTDMESDVDDVGTLALLHALSDLGEAQILATISSSTYQWTPPCLDAINTYYGHPDIPVGTVKENGVYRESRYAKTIAEEFPHDLHAPEDVPDAIELYRKILSQQPDQSVVIVTVGYLTNLNHLLKSEADEFSELSGKELVAKKVKLWVCMGGKIPEGIEHNILIDKQASYEVIPEWNTPIMFSPWDIGNRIMTGAALKEAAEDHPVRRSYELFNGLKDRQSWDQSAVLYAVRGLRDYWDAETQGYFKVNIDGSNEWLPEPDRDHAYLREKMEPEKLAKIIEDLMLQPPQ